MRAKTYAECFAKTATGKMIAKAARTATDIVEERIAARIDTNPVSVTRAVAMREVFAADPALYEKYRRENTVGRDGQVLDRNPAAHNVGVGKSESVDEEVSRRVANLVSKTEGATPQQALAFIFRNDPSLFERWRNAYA